MLLLFWLYSAIMIPFAVIPYEAKISTLRFGCYVGTYWAVANIVSRFPRRKAVWCTLFTALLAVALYSLVQHKINFEMLYGQLRYANYGERLGGTYICPNHIAHLFQMWIPLCAVFLFIPQMGWFWRICFGYALPVFSLLIYQTQSRAGLLGMIAAIGTLFLLLMLRRSRKSFVLALVAAPLLMAAGVGGLWAGSSMFRDRMQPVVKVLTKASQGEWEQVASLDFRPMTWFDAFEMAGERPWFGYGPGNYGQTFPEHRKRWKGVRRETVHPHNEPLELLTEYGVVGSGLFIAVLIAFCVPLIRLMKTSSGAYHALPAAACLAALAGTLVHGLFDFELRIFPNALMLSVLAGCAVAPLLQQQRDKRERDVKSFTTANARGIESDFGVGDI
jgi:O-antigen ligase